MCFSEMEVGMKFGKRWKSWSVVNNYFYFKTSAHMADFGNTALKNALHIGLYFTLKIIFFWKIFSLFCSKNKLAFV